MESLTFAVEYIRNVAVISMVLFLVTNLNYFRDLLNERTVSPVNQLILTGVFTGLSLVGTALGALSGSLFMDVSLIVIMISGFFCGPVIGLGTGIAWAVCRYFIGVDGVQTIVPAMFVYMFSGYLCGILCRLFGRRQFTVYKIISIAVLVEGLYWIGEIWFYSAHFDATTGLPFIVTMHAIAVIMGTLLCYYIAKGPMMPRERLRAISAQQAMRVILEARGVLSQHGLDRISAYRLAKIIFREINADAVAITDTTSILAFVGENDNYKRAKDALQLRGDGVSTMECDGKVQLCQRLKSCLEPVIDLPLRIDSRIVGSVVIYKAKHGQVDPYEVKLIEGVVNYLNLELLQTELNQKTALLMQAEFNSLKSQIRPHFLFNMMANISALIRTNPNKARSLIKDLSDFLRIHLKSGKEEITVSEELEYVDIYVRLEQARFGRRITVIKKMAVEALSHKVPTFSIQVLVENAVKHGITKVKNGGLVYITVSHRKDFLCINVEDNGIGIEPDRLQHLKKMDYIVNTKENTGLGLKNVNARLKKLYGEDCGLHIESLQGAGTKVGFKIPWNEEGEVANYEGVASNDR